jgi:cell division protein FtsL
MATVPNYHRKSYEQGRAYRRNLQGNSRNEYVYGNLARELEEVPERVRRPKRRRKRKVYPQQKPVAMPSMGAASFVFLISAVLVTVAVCFAYLYVQSGITSMKNQVVSLQAEIAQTKQENQETYEKIMDSVDLSEVYAIATGELGMTQAVDNQVYKYNNSKSDMVKQYGDIPSSTK